MTTQEMLEQTGWVRLSRRKMGMIIIAFWYDRKMGQTFRQGEAVTIQRERNKLKKGKCYMTSAQRLKLARLYTQREKFAEIMRLSAKLKGRLPQ